MNRQDIFISRKNVSLQQITEDTMINQDTICAIATAQGGAIGTIRVSGTKP